MDAIGKTMGGKGTLPALQCESLDEHVHRAWSSFNDETGADAPAPRRGLTHFPVAEPDGDPRVPMQAAFDAVIPFDSAFPAAELTIRSSDAEYNDVDFNDTEFNDAEFNADNANINMAGWQPLPLPVRPEHAPLKINFPTAGTLLPDAPPLLQRSVSAPQFGPGVMLHRKTIQPLITATGQMPQRRRIDGKLPAPATHAPATTNTSVTNTAVAGQTITEVRQDLRTSSGTVRAALPEAAVQMHPRGFQLEQPAAAGENSMPEQLSVRPPIPWTPQQRDAGGKRLVPATHAPTAHASNTGPTITEVRQDLRAASGGERAALPEAAAQIHPRGLQVEPLATASENAIPAQPANTPQPQPISGALQAATDAPHKEKSPPQAISDAQPLPFPQQPAPQRPPSAAPDAALPAQAKNTPQQPSAAMVAAPAPASAANGGSTLTYRFDKWNGNHAVTVQAPTKADAPQYILAPSDSMVSQRLSEHLAQNPQMADIPAMRLSDADERQQQPRQQTPQEDDEDEA
ncbi:MAG: hypothetical protein JWQ10_340 [Herbaspirillum sp.]|nr:hypothetical protein [Herbaspirillum sp.]